MKKTSDDWHIYQLNDSDWWLARTLDEAKADALVYFGQDTEMITPDAHQLSARELDTLMYKADGGETRVSFRQELASRVAGGPKVEMFATSNL